MKTTPQRITIAVAFTLFFIGCNREADTPSCSLKDAQDEDHCNCEMALPVTAVDLLSAEINSLNRKLVGFGTHSGSGVVEGHRGIDFISDAPLAIKAPGDGIIVKIEKSPMTEYKADANQVAITIKLDCGVISVIDPVAPGHGIVVGTKVTSGKVIGTLSKVTPAATETSPEPKAAYLTHWSTEVISDESATRYLCPATFISTSDSEKIAIALGESEFEERNARTQNYHCADGTTLDLDLPPENTVCNARLPASQAALLSKCLNLATSRPIW